LINFKPSKKAIKEVDKLIAKYKEEKSIRLDFIFDSVLNSLKASNKLDKILAMGEKKNATMETNFKRTLLL
jgi:hypothetical protein